MKYNLNQFFLYAFVALIFACTPQGNRILVSTIDELNRAIENAQQGTTIVLANGTWSDVQIKFYGQGSEKSPIKLVAETPGKVFLEGQSNLHLGGKYLVVDGLYFRAGYSPHKGIIRYKIGKDSTAFHSRVTNTVIDGFTRPNRWENDRWVELYGQYNQFDHNYIAGKSNDGATFMVYHDGNEHTDSHHQIVDNYFGPRPRKGGPRGETLRLGGSETSMTPGKVTVENNFFDRCNGEVEIVSDKTNFNRFVNNVFYKCEGSLVMRHGNYTTVDGNMFIGDDDSNFYGGIRVVSTGHWITNNYFYKISGEEFRSPLALMNGIPKTPLNRYKQVTDVVIAHNTWVNCTAPIQVGIGQNNASKDVLPLSEIRSAPPIRSVFANNIIYATNPRSIPLVNHDDISGIQFKNNLFSNGVNSSVEYPQFTQKEIPMEQINDWLYVPTQEGNELLQDYHSGFSFDQINKDIFGSNRAKNNRIGAVTNSLKARGFKIDKSLYGPTWFSPEVKKSSPTVHLVKATEGALQTALRLANSGDTIELIDNQYSFGSPLVIDKEISIRSAAERKPILIYTGEQGTPAFELHPHGRLALERLSLQGNGQQIAFAPREKNMSAAYKLFVKESVVENFEHILLASRGSFADSIGVYKTKFNKMKNGFVLAADQKGDYNAEMFTISSSSFENIKQNVIHFYRGGYDESTIGGVLTIRNTRFANSGQAEKSGILLKTRGIINVLLEGNSFVNNPVRRVAVLWGAKNNQHQENTVITSGEIEVQEQQALEILY